MTDFGTVGDLLAANPQWPGEGVPDVVARLLEPEGWPGEGIFFGMDEAIYHSIFACSASVLKDMSVSPMYAWAKSPLNPDREDDDTFAKVLGRAYHVRICEGAAVYAERYALALDKRDFPDALETVDAIKKAIVDAGEKPVTKGEAGAPAKKGDWIVQLLALDPAAQIWDAMVDAHADSIGTRTLIRAEDDKRIQVAARMIEADPELAKAFSGGYAECSIFWWDARTGAPCKARLDYLRMDGFSDLKTFSLKSEMPVERAIVREIASRRHFIPVCHYSDAIAAAKTMIRERGDAAIIACAGVEGDVHEWARKWAAGGGDPQALYCFQATGVAPITRGKIMPREEIGTFGVTQRRVEELRRVFAMNVEVYGTDPWLDIAPIETIEDSDIPMWATEI